jgi:hypothetical protein
MDTAESVEVEKSPLREAYVLLNATHPAELSTRYTQEDQRLMKLQKWDYKDHDLIINKIRHILENADMGKLADSEKEWRSNILWFWYHHAISCAIWRYKDKLKARNFSAKALEFQSATHPNKITRLFYLLLNNRMDEAEKWGAVITNEPEKTTAKRLVAEYKRDSFGL